MSLEVMITLVPNHVCCDYDEIMKNLRIIKAALLSRDKGKIYEITHPKVEEAFQYQLCAALPIWKPEVPNIYIVWFFLVYFYFWFFVDSHKSVILSKINSNLSILWLLEPFLPYNANMTAVFSLLDLWNFSTFLRSYWKL